MRAQAREHLTHARARCASTDRRARETREQIEARAREVCEQGQDARACSRARARPTRARANKLAKSGFGELICDLESLFARAESLFARARVGRARARTRARILALLAHLARARVRLYLLARLARAPVVARAPRARTC